MAGERRKDVFARSWWSGERRLRAAARREARGGLSLAVRLIPGTPPALDVLGAPPVFESVLSELGGLVLIAGPAASGRSTLLAAAVQHLNTTAARRIAYLGAPPEFVFPEGQSTVFSIDPRESGRSAGEVLRGLDFHDIDVAVIDMCLRGDDLYEVLLTAQAGTLVLLLESGLSMRYVLGGLEKSLPAGRRRAARDLLAESLRAGFIQRLVSRSDGQGRMAVHEICLQSRSLGDPFREGRWEAVPKVMATARQQGMRLLDDSLDEALRQNRITGAEAFQCAFDKSRFLQFAPTEWQSGAP